MTKMCLIFEVGGRGVVELLVVVVGALAGVDPPEPARLDTGELDEALWLEAPPVIGVAALVVGETALDADAAVAVETAGGCAVIRTTTRWRSAAMTAVGTGPDPSAAVITRTVDSADAIANTSICEVRTRQAVRQFLTGRSPRPRTGHRTRRPGRRCRRRTSSCRRRLRLRYRGSAAIAQARRRRVGARRLVA